MNTSFPNLTARADKTAAANAAKRASITRADTEQEAQFQDLLSDRKTHEASAGTDATASDAASRLAAARRAALERTSTADGADRANPPSQPVEAVSVQQAMLTAPARVDQDAREAATGEPGGSPPADIDANLPANDVASQTSLSVAPSPIDPHGPPVCGDDDPTPLARTKPPLIAPHGPPVSDDGGDESLPTGGIKAPPTDPHGPPVSLEGSDTQPVGGVKPSPIAPHGPPTVAADDYSVVPASPTVGQDKPLVIRPHGPVETDPSLRIGEQSAAAERADAVLQAEPAPAPFFNPLNTSLNDSAPRAQTSVTLVSMPPDRTNPGGSLKTEYTTAIPDWGGSLTAPPAANALPITTAAQAQLVGTATPGTSDNVAAVGTAVFLASDPANLAAHVGQAQMKVAGRNSANLSQNTEQEFITTNNSINGTATAKRQENVMTYPSSIEAATGRAALSNADADGFAALGLSDGWSSDSLRGRAKDGDAARASVAPVLSTDSSSATAQTPFAAPPSAAPSTGIVQVDRMEALLQTVQQTAEQVRFNGTGQVELRVRLAGVADDVTVQVHLDANRQAQVSFQTGSPELRAALEQGWSDLTATTAAEFSPASVSDLSSDRPTANPAPTDSYRDDRRAFAATTSAPSGQTPRRWSGYA